MARAVSCAVPHPPVPRKADPVEAIARSILYEGYILWPYRRSALKKERRWTFGGVYPRAYSHSGHGDDPCVMRTECLIEGEPDAPIELDVSIRFLHVVERRVMQTNASGSRFVDSMTVGDTTYVSWQEAIERTIEPPTLDIRDGPAHTPLQIDAGGRSEPIVGADGLLAGTIVRTWRSITGAVDISAARVAECVWKVRVDVSNQSAWSGESRELTLLRTLASTHGLLTVRGGTFVSLSDPPAELAAVAAGCKNDGTWPVLVGSVSQRNSLLCSPIDLPDFPTLKAQSRGDVFGSAEIDHRSVLNALSLTDDEQREMREANPRAREVLDHYRRMSSDEFLKLHGVTRERDFAAMAP